jgi:replicative DNA helicase Mcm
MMDQDDTEMNNAPQGGMNKDDQRQGSADVSIVSRWEAFFQGTDYMQKIGEVSDLYPEVKSIFVVYLDLDKFDADLAVYLLEHPDLSLIAGKQAIKNLMHQDMRKADINLRIIQLPRDSRVEIRELRAKHVGKFLSVEGLVRKATEVRPKITDGLFQCLRCGHIIKESQEGLFFKEPLECYKEQDGCGRSAGSTKFKLLTDESRFVDTQKLEVQESPEGLRGGAQPERLTGYMEDDIAGKVSPGDRVVLNGILRSVQKGQPNKSTLFDINLDIIAAEFQQHEYEEIAISPEDEAEIISVAKSPDLFKKVVSSISPSIFGYDMEKEAIALQLFGGCEKHLDDGTRIRGDIHILLVGDPGVAKSQILRYMSRLAPRGIYASGKSSSAAGLCVAPNTTIVVNGREERIGDFVESRMRSPQETKPGQWSQHLADQCAVLTMSDRCQTAQKVQSIWRIATPSFLVELTESSGKRLTLTPATKVWGKPDGTNDGWVLASDIKVGQSVLVADGHPEGGFKWSSVTSVKRLSEDLPPFVYDLTVEGAHCFLGNGFVVHNTAAAVKDDFGEGRWTLEAGALVLADKGLAAIDEMDKMTDQDRSSMHEAMESQTISVAKAGITATLQCRCSMLGAANPKYGRFEEHQYIADQINMPPALLSRFDLIFAMTDKPQHDKDLNITTHILKAHRRGQLKKYANPEEIQGVDAVKILADTMVIQPTLTRDFLRKYVAYAKRVNPVLSDDAVKIISDFYLKIRKQGEGEGSSVPITARQLEAFVRLSEASARARLSTLVTADDALRAVKVVEYYLRKIAGEGDKLDFDIIATGTSHSQREQISILKDIIGKLSKDVDPRKGVNGEELFKAAADKGIPEDRAKTLLKRLSQNGEIYSPSSGFYKLASEG